MPEIELPCPQCGADAIAEVTVVPTMGDAGSSVVGYRCPNGCDYSQVKQSVDATLGVRQDLG